MSFKIPSQEFTQKTGIDIDGFRQNAGTPEFVIPFRDMTNVCNVHAMPESYLRTLLVSVPLAGNASTYPYRLCESTRERMELSHVKVAQTFVERSKVLSLVENVGKSLTGFCVPRGFAKLTPHIIVGTNKANQLCLAHYLPPIVEVHGNQRCLLDGTHRGFLAKSIGTTIEVIVLHHVITEFPATPQAWDGVSLVDEKPEKGKRNIGLRAEVFRDLKAVGIDG